LNLARTAKAVSQAFDAALVAAGGSLPSWVILLALKTGRAASQSKLAESVGIQGATLTHHLNAMEKNGLLTRQRDPDNRRIHRVELTENGEQLFRQLRGAAVAFDRKLRAGLGDEEVAGLEALLARLRENVDAGAPTDG
jgi:MarR family transcriptional regulator for hemolysin